jgi:hypothetical protein
MDGGIVVVPGKKIRKASSTDGLRVSELIERQLGIAMTE